MWACISIRCATLLLLASRVATFHTAARPRTDAAFTSVSSFSRRGRMASSIPPSRKSLRLSSELKPLSTLESFLEEILSSLPSLPALWSPAGERGAPPPSAGRNLALKQNRALSEELAGLAASHFLLEGAARLPESREGLQQGHEQQEKRVKRMNTLIDALVAARAPFDDASSLRGGLWVSAYNRGAAEPRWRSLATASARVSRRAASLRAPSPTSPRTRVRGPEIKRAPNLSGQRYDVGAKTVLNYSELLGQHLFITARGTFQEPALLSSSSLSAGSGGGGDDGGGGGLARTRSGKRCPVDYDVSITGGSVEFFGGTTAAATRGSGGGFVLPLPIQGKGFLRVLYADDLCRIFLSPTESPDRWEDAGLVVVQVPLTRVGNSVASATTGQAVAEKGGGDMRQQGYWFGEKGDWNEPQ
mmetsp:Transcript_88134/g.170688  ORF Transcript_88134/g.170688 Transcript_88134/m.170688 type:complete len:417 (+) Transcript_88134:34-1284(+)